MTILVTSQKDQGKVRERQEDSCFAFADKHKAVLILSDGMGGHASGDLASQAAVAAAYEILEPWPELPFGEAVEHNQEASNLLDEATNSVESSSAGDGLSILTSPASEDAMSDYLMSVEEWVKSEGLAEETVAQIPQRAEVVNALRSAFDRAQHFVSDIGLDVSYGLGSAGCTLTVGLIANGWLHVGHIGDSRAYLFRNGYLEQLTMDHSGASLLVAAGVISPEEARHHPESHSLYRFLGINAVELTVDIHHAMLQSGDIILICSDGLWGMVPDEQMTNLLQQTNSIEEAANALLFDANRAGGEDNISVAIAQV